MAAPDTSKMSKPVRREWVQRKGIVMTATLANYLELIHLYARQNKPYRTRDAQGEYIDGHFRMSDLFPNLASKINQTQFSDRYTRMSALNDLLGACRRNGVSYHDITEKAPSGLLLSYDEIYRRLTIECEKRGFSTRYVLDSCMTFDEIVRLHQKCVDNDIDVIDRDTKMPRSVSVLQFELLKAQPGTRRYKAKDQCMFIDPLDGELVGDPTVVEDET